MNQMIDSLLALAVEHHLAGRLPAAIALYEQLLSAQPACPDALCNLGQIRDHLGQTDEALHLLRSAVALAPDHAPALLNLGATLLRQGDAAAALPLLDRALKQDPGSFMAWNNRGLALQKLDRRAEAAQSFTQALQIRPTHDAALNNLGLLLHELGRGSEAIAHLRRALDLCPDAAETACNLAAPLLAQGRVDDAIRCYERALGLRPDLYEAHTGLLLALHYGDPSPGQEAALQAARARFAATFPARAPGPRAAPLRRHLPPPGRPLRIGYVSPDLRAHAVSFFIAPLLAAHDRDRVHVTCYASVARPDAVTARLRGLADAWRDVYGLSDEALAAAVRADETDVLVDLAGHTTGNRLRAFLYRPAPLQVTYLGYPDRTGLPTLDARLTDALADPEGDESPVHAAEPLLRLPRCFLCYEPPADAPPPSPLPADRNHAITFASFNNLPKLSPSTLATWAEILKALPTSRLLLKSAAFSDPGAVAFTQERFRRHGVGPARLDLRPLTPSITAHLACYHEADIALDTFPYHGTTTTCEALFMGLPVVTQAGPSHKSRVGVTLLHQVGLPSLIAQGQPSYVRLAIALAQDLPRLRALRATLRRHLLASPLCDARSLSRSIEDALLSMARGDAKALLTGCAT